MLVYLFVCLLARLCENNVPYLWISVSQLAYREPKAI